MIYSYLRRDCSGNSLSRSVLFGNMEDRNARFRGTWEDENSWHTGESRVHGRSHISSGIVYSPVEYNRE